MKNRDLQEKDKTDELIKTIKENNKPLENKIDLIALGTQATLRNDLLNCYYACDKKGYKTHEDIQNFADMYEAYLEHVDKHGEKNTTIDRIDVNGNYCKENCRWATLQEQVNNRRNTIHVYYGNQKYALGDLCRIVNKDYRLVYNRIKSGWNIFQALFTQKGEKLNEQIR